VLSPPRKRTFAVAEEEGATPVRKAAVSYAQNAEDIRLWRVFSSISSGCYVDVGAGDPASGSVTKLFYDRGWSGLNIEPGPTYARLAEARPRDVNIRAAIGPQDDASVSFFLTFPDPGMSTLDPTAHAHVPEAVERMERINVPQQRLETVLRQHAQGRTIHFLKVDVEGAERDVLASSDWQSFRPIVVVVEAIRSWSRRTTHDEWEQILTSAGYEFAAFDGINRFYVERAHANLRESLAYPISPLDHYTPARLHEAERELRVQEQTLTAFREEIARLAAPQSGISELDSLRVENARLKTELAAVYASRIWRVGTRAVSTAARGLTLLQRPRRLKRNSPLQEYLAAISPRHVWHFPQGRGLMPRWSLRRDPLRPIVEALGPSSAPLTEARARDVARAIEQSSWTSEAALQERRFSREDRLAILEADAIVRAVSARKSHSANPVTKATGIPLVVVDIRCLQDPQYRNRGVGVHSRFVLETIKAVAESRPLALLTSAELPPPEEQLRELADLVVSTPYELRDRDVCLFVELSPMTAGVVATIPFLTNAACKTVAVVYDFIPTEFPAAYLKSSRAALTERVRLEALRAYDLLLPISETTAAACGHILKTNAEIRVTGVADPLREVVSGQSRDGARERFMIVPIGGDARKNPVAALAVVATHRREGGESLRAVFTGGLTGGQEHALRDIANRLGVADAVDVRGNLPEADLAGLYQTADLAFIPSFTEGFSIPVAEAVLRGTPVVASDIPVHHELLGPGPWLADARDIPSLSAAVNQVRADREGVAAQQRAALDDIADGGAVRERISVPLSELLSEVDESTEHPSRRTTGTRARLAFVSPFPPQRSGVADYTRFTVKHLSTYADVEIYSASPNPDRLDNVPVHAVSGAPHVESRFDAVVNVLGNSHFHFPILDLLDSYGGACIAHDNRMVEAYRHDRGDSWTAELISQPGQHVHPEGLLALLDDLDRLPSSGYDVIAREAAPLMVHGRALAEVIHAETGTRPAILPFVPYNIPPFDVVDADTHGRARARLGFDPQKLHLGTLGIVDRRTKGIDLIVSALAWLRGWGIAPELHIVGDAPFVERHAVRRFAREIGVEDAVTFHGHVPRSILEDFLLGLDGAVQLRTSARLSLSGTLADCIAFGLPTVTSEPIARELDAPSYAEPTPVVTSSLLVAEAITNLANRRKQAAAIDEKRRTYLATRSPDAYARALLTALDLA
jgi:FkbM family methyltransferase